MVLAPCEGPGGTAVCSGRVISEWMVSGEAGAGWLRGEAGERGGAAVEQGCCNLQVTELEKAGEEECDLFFSSFVLSFTLYSAFTFSSLLAPCKHPYHAESIFIHPLFIIFLSLQPFECFFRFSGPKKPLFFITHRAK